MESYTLARSCSFEGTGIHTGTKSRVRLLPLEKPDGICLYDGGNVLSLKEVPLSSSHYATVIGREEKKVSTVEHLLAALAFSGIDHVLICQEEGPEVPILDGSSVSFTKEIEKAGKLPLKQSRQYVTVKAPFSLTLGKSSLTILPASQEQKEKASLRLSYFFTHDQYTPSCYFFEGTVQKLGKEVERARTFGHLEHFSFLSSQGIARGASLENSLVFKEGKALTPLRFPNEPIRHKVLDLIGDLMLAQGVPFIGRIIAYNTGHAFHAACLNLLRKEEKIELLITH